MKSEDRRKQDEQDLRSLLGKPEGRRFFYRVLAQSGLYSSSYASDATATAFNEGRRDVAIRLLREAQRVAPDLYARGLREAIDAEELELLDAKKAEPLPE